MEKKDIIIYSLVAVFLILSFYRRYMKNKNKAAAGNNKNIVGKGGLSSHPDDYEPYSGKKNN